MGDRAMAIARQGLSYGMHVMTSANGWFVGQKQGLLNVSNARIQLRLSNPDESQMGTSTERRRAARNTLDRPGFGLTREGHEMLVGVPEITGTDSERVSARGIGAVIAEVTGADKVERLSRLPERVALSQIVEAYQGTAEASDPLNIPFAIGESALQPVALPARSLAQHAGDGPPALRQDHGTGGHRPGDHPAIHPGTGADHRDRPEDHADREDPRATCTRLCLYRRRHRRGDRRAGGRVARSPPTVGSDPGGTDEPQVMGGAATLRLDR